MFPPRGPEPVVNPEIVRVSRLVGRDARGRIETLGTGYGDAGRARDVAPGVRVRRVDHTAAEVEGRRPGCPVIDPDDLYGGRRDPKRRPRGLHLAGTERAPERPRRREDTSSALQLDVMERLQGLVRERPGDVDPPAIVRHGDGPDRR